MLQRQYKAAAVDLAESHWIGGPGNAFCRHEFAVDSVPQKATLKIIADPHTYAINHWQILPAKYKYEQWLVGGSFIKYRVFVNGAQAAVGPFRPLEDGTPVLQEYDVTALLCEGRNALAVLSRGELKGFSLCLVIEQADGGKRFVRSSADWKQRDANNVYRTVCWECPAIDQYFKGSPGPGEYQEHLDGRVYPQGWKTAGFNDTTWSPAATFGLATQDCELCRTPPYRIERVYPTTITKLADGNYLFDFGRSVFGGIELAAPPKGGVVELRLAEELQPNGRARFQLRSENCYQERWTYSAGSEPLAHMGARIFRYAEVIDWHGEADLETICVASIGAPFDSESSSMDCSDANLQRVWQFCKTSVAHTTADVYTDCLSRERLAYEADAYVTMLTQFSTEGSFETARRTLDYLTTHPTFPVEWWQCYIPLFYEYLLHSGDYDFVQHHYTFLRDETSFHPRMRNGLIREFPREPHVDWPPSTRDGFDFGEANAVPNAYAYWDLDLLHKLARWLGHEQESRQFADVASELRAAFNRELFDETTGLYVDSIGSKHSSLHTNMYALRFGLVPDDRIARCLAYVKSRGMACSVYTAQFLLETLFQYREDEAAVALMTSDGERSWLDMIRKGATVTTESWLADNKSNMSWVHPWGSSPANVVVRYLFGVRPTAPGWGDFTFDPRPGGVERGRLRVTTPRGEIVATFERVAGKYEFDIKPSFRKEGPEVSEWVRRLRTRAGQLQLTQ